MNEPEERQPTSAEHAAREAVRGLFRPTPEAAFSARLRHEFVSGRIGRRRGLVDAGPWFGRAGFWVPLAASLLAVAAVAANRGPDWSVVSADGEGRVVVDGVSLPSSDRDGIASRVRRGGRVTVQGAVTLDLVARGVAAVALAPGAEMTLSPAPNRWWRRAMSARLAAGDAYFSTGRSFHGARLDVVTPQANVRAVGTSFAVLCFPLETCVCVMEGRVRVGAGSLASEVEVPAGMRRVVHAERAAETLPILDDSVHRLHRQLSAVGGALDRSR